MDELKTKYICLNDRCVWKVFISPGIWLCPFKRCIEKSKNGKRLYFKIRK